MMRKKNNDLNFNLKLRKLQTRLDMWRARDLTLFGRVLIIKSLGLSKIIHSISNIEVPDGIAGAVRKNLFNFIWKNKKEANLPVSGSRKRGNTHDGRRYYV